MPTRRGGVAIAGRDRDPCALLGWAHTAQLVAHRAVGRCLGGRSRALQSKPCRPSSGDRECISTNHIAAEADVSPGNLYYHFKHKQEIIRALLEWHIQEHENLWEPSPDGGENLAKLRDNLTSGAAAAWAYRFFEREILALLRADPELRASYNDAYQRRLGEWQAFIEQLVEQRMMRPPRPPRTLNDLVVAIWLVAGGWLAFLDVTGDPQDRVQIAKQTDLLLVILDPYLTAKGRRRFSESGP